MVMWKGGSIMNLPELTHEEEVNLERFANLMIELIEKHADAVDKVKSIFVCKFIFQLY